MVEEKEFMGKIMEKYSMDGRYSGREPNLVLRKGRTGKYSVENLKTLLSADNREKIIEKEVQSVVRHNYIHQYRQLRFEDMRSFFRSLSLEEEKEFSGFLYRFLKEDMLSFSLEAEKNKEKIEELSASVMELFHREANKEEAYLEIEQEMREHNSGEKREIDDEVIRKIAEQVIDKMESKQRLEGMRRGYC